MKELQQLNELMSDSVKDAISYIKYVNNEDVELNVSGLQELERVLVKLSQEHQSTPLDDKVLFTVSTMFGAFIGELFKAQAGGQWFMDETDPKAPFIVLNYAGRSYPFASVCFEKIVNDPDISVFNYFERALNNTK